MQLRRADVLDGALAILDEYGLADLTMRRLASSLGVQPGALYWHFPNKQTLLGALADRILAPLDSQVLSAVPWDERSRSLPIDYATRCWRTATVPNWSRRPMPPASSPAAHGTASSTRRRAPASLRPEAALTADTLMYYVLGETVDEQARIQMDSPGALTEDASPLFETPDATERFEFGLQLFVNGGAARGRGARSADGPLSLSAHSSQKSTGSRRFRPGLCGQARAFRRRRPMRITSSATAAVDANTSAAA